MSQNSTPGFRRLPRVADRLTPAHLDLVEQSLAAERSGDAARALALHEAVPAFARRSRHHVVLAQLAPVEKVLPGWAWVRWLGYQSVRCEDPGTEVGTLQRAALKYTVETFHGDQLADCHADGGDPIKVIAWVAAESWIFHQLWLHELGGLRRFVDEIAVGRLAEHAALARSWAGAPLRGFHISASSTGGRLSVHDPAADCRVDVLDLGALACAGSDGWVLGRLVPSGVGDVLMFDAPPTAVPERVARDVSAAAEPWKVVKEALDEGTLVERSFMRADYELVTDVPSIDLLRVGTAPDDLERRVTAQLRAGRDEIPRAAFRIIRRALDGTLSDCDAPHLAAAVLQPRALADARRLLVRERQYDLWSRWSSMVHEPARGLLRELAEASRTAA